MPTPPESETGPFGAVLDQLALDVRTAAGWGPERDVFEQEMRLPESRRDYATVELLTTSYDREKSTFGSTFYRCPFRISYRFDDADADSRLRRKIAVFLALMPLLAPRNVPSFRYAEVGQLPVVEEAGFDDSSDEGDLGHDLIVTFAVTLKLP